MQIFGEIPFVRSFHCRQYYQLFCNKVSIVPTIIDSDEKKNADINIVIFHVQCVG